MPLRHIAALACLALTAAAPPEQRLDVALSNFASTPSMIPLVHGQRYVLHLSSKGGHSFAATQSCPPSAQSAKPILQASASSALRGETVELRWFGRYEKVDAYLPPACLEGWEVSDPAIATLSADRRQLRISASAALNAQVTVRVRAGEQEAIVRVRVRPPGEVVLWGTWRAVKAEHCGRLPAELQFGRTDEFNFTFTEQMVETMVSGAGSYAWRPEAGTLMLDGVPTRAALKDGRLVIEGAGFTTGTRADGRVASAPQCTSIWSPAG